MNCTICGKELTETGNDFLNMICSECRLTGKGLTNVKPMQGWICPRCGVVHSPFVDKCDCPLATITRSTNGVSVASGGNTTTNFME